MRIVIVFESMFGNTAAFAADVGAGLVDAGATVVLADVASTAAQAPTPCDLLVLAAPTHAFTLSRPASRAEAVAKGAPPERAATGLREWLATLATAVPASSPRPAVAVFDTRVTKVRHLPGSAARSAARALARSGFDVVDRASFFVDGITGPASPGEHERARAWGHHLAAQDHQARCTEAFASAPSAAEAGASVAWTTSATGPSSSASTAPPAVTQPSRGPSTRRHGGG